MAELAEVLRKTARLDKEGGCGLVWGAVPGEALTRPLGHGALRRVHLELPRASIHGWIGCRQAVAALAEGCGAETPICNAALHDLVILSWKDGKLWGSHPADDGGAEINWADLDPNMFRPGEKVQGEILMFGKEPAALALSRMAEVPAFVVVHWSLTEKKH